MFGGQSDNHSFCFECKETNAVYIPLPYLLIGQLLAAIAITVLALPLVDTLSATIWLSLVILFLLYRTIYFIIFKKTDSAHKKEKERLWLNRYYLNTLISGLIWGSSAFLVLPSSDAIAQTSVLLLIILAGFASMGALVNKWKLLLLYFLVTFGPVLLKLSWMPGKNIHYMTYLMGALTFVLIIFARYYGQMISVYFSLGNKQMKIEGIENILKQKIFSAFEHAPLGVIYYDSDLRIEKINETAANFFGRNKHENIIGLPIGVIWQDEKILVHHKKVLRGFEVEAPETIKIENSTSSKDFYVNLFSAPAFDSEGRIVGGISIITDISSEINAKNELERLRYYDTLTGLPNKELLLKNLKNVIFDKLRTNNYGALLFLDIDHFNNINRIYGQNVGDKVLKKIAEFFRDSIKKNEIVARISADTFVFLLPELAEEKEESKKAVFDFVSGLKESFKKVMVLGEADYYINLTAGAILFDNNDLSALELMKYAENALKEAKNKARGTVRFYEMERDRSALYDLTIANDIHKAVKNNELTVYYQPQQDIHSGILTGAEALVRWDHPRKGSISPAHFIPIAEKSGAIVQLEEWIFEQIFKDMRSMAKLFSDFPLNYIAVNVTSSHFLQPDFIEKFTELVHRYRINPLWINIEITESDIMQDIDEAIKRINEMKRLGFGFSIDDFGTGYSSLTYLKELPVDIIKIDRAFVKDADRNENDRLIVESVIDISQKFGFKVLAEGIDRQETLDYFKTTSCKTFQGYLYYKPLSMEEFVQII